MQDLGKLVLRLTVGTLMAGHGAQKLFGWFGGPGLKGTQGFMESLGMRPGKIWGTMAALSEFNGGVLTVLGFLNPLGPLNIGAAMTVAIRRAHWNKPIWNMQGGAELPLTNLAVALSLTLMGPGRYSLDNLFGIRLPRWFAGLAWISTIGGIIAALQRPELAETVMQRATSALSTGLAGSTNDPTIEVETRPRAEEPQEVPTTP